MELFENYIAGTVTLLLNGREEEIRECLGQDDSKKVLQGFFGTDDPTLVLKYTPPQDEKVDAASDEKGAGGGDDDDSSSIGGTYSFHAEIPDETIETKNKSLLLVYVKTHQGHLDEEKPMAFQLLASRVVSGSPLNEILSYVRHTFLPVATGMVHAEEKASGKGSASSGSVLSRQKAPAKTTSRVAAVLSQLRDLEVKLAETQDEQVMATVSLEPTPLVREYIDLLDDKEAKRVERAMDATMELIKSNSTDIPSLQEPRVTTLRKLSEQRSLEELKNCLKQWKEQIQVVLRQSNTGALTTVQKQIRFWENKKQSINELEAQLDTNVVKASLHVLKLNNSIFWITQFNTLGVLDVKKDVDKHYSVLSGFPMQSLLKASSVEGITKTIGEIFKYLDSQKIKQHYKAEEIKQLGRDSARDIAHRLYEVLSRDVMFIKYGEFQRKTKGTERLFREFQHKYSKWQTEVRQLRLRQRYSAWGSLRDEETELNSLEKRVESMKEIRKSHDELSKVVDPRFSSGDKEVLVETQEKVTEAYAIFRSHDCLRCTASQWKQLCETYASTIKEVESDLRDMIRSKMEAAADPRQRFRVCEKFNKLFVRDRIRSAVWDFSQDLIQNVESEVEQLRERYRSRYSKIAASKLTALRDIPAVSGEVIWLKQLRRQLDSHERRVQAVLGDKWQDYNSGKGLAELITRLTDKLDPKHIIASWVKEANSLPQFDSDAFIFSIEKGVGGGGSAHVSLKVNFDEKYVVLFKEMRRLQSLGIRIHKHHTPMGPRSKGISGTARRIDVQVQLDCIDVKRRYPVSVKLKEAVSIFSRTSRQIERTMAELGAVVSNTSMMSELYKLVDEYKLKCQKRLTSGITQRWSTPDKLLNNYVDGLAKATIDLQDATGQAFDLSRECDDVLEDLLKCDLRPEIMTSHLESLQTIVSKLDDANFSGVPDWTSCLNSKVEKILLSRIDAVIDGFRATLESNWPIDASKEDLAEMREANPFYRETPIIHTVRMSSTGKLTVEPPMAEAQMRLGQDLQVWLAMVVALKQPRSEREDDDEGDGSFRSILKSLNITKIVDCYSKINDISRNATKYANEWLAYQALWDMDIGQVFESLGEDIGRWRKLLTDMKKAQSSFDSGDAEKSFGPIVVQYGSVRSKVDSKYIDFRKQTFKTLFVRLGKLVRDFHKDATKGKYELEETSFAVATIKDIVKAVTLLQRLKDESAGWNELWEEVKEAEKMLQANRYQLPPTWIRASRMRGVLDDFFSVLDKRWSALQTEAQSIYGKLESQFSVIENETKMLEERWHAEKPTEGWASTWDVGEVQDWLRESNKGVLRFALETARNNGLDGQGLASINRAKDRAIFGQIERRLEITESGKQESLATAIRGLLFGPADVEKKLHEFEQSLIDIEGNFAEVKNAKEAMKVVIDIAHSEEEDSIETLVDGMKKELAGLKEVHRALANKWKEMQTMGTSKFLGLDCRELGKALRAMEDDLAKLPNKIRTYQVFHKFIKIIKEKQKMNKQIFEELSSGVLRQKHWTRLSKVLNLRKAAVDPSKLTLHDIWSINLIKFAKEIGEVVTIARGENALENFLKDLTDKWNETNFELVDYKGKCPLVKNWNELREDVADALTDVMSMKQSPFFKTFEREAIVWDEKLNSAQAIFDVMVDVQRRWVYLQGVFTSSADVQRQLGLMYQKFKAFNRDFTQLMRGIKQTPLVDPWVLPEKGLLAMLEQNQSTLNTIQKALNEYLESQRSAFSRFYFIGDEDLLEIIGSSKDPKAINRHFAKMFAGLAQLLLHPDNEGVIIGMASREGEEVMFKEPVDVEKSKKIQDWLLAVEYQMRFTLACLLEEAVSSLVTPDKVDEYFAWAGNFPAQVALLATQVRWSEAIDNNLKALNEANNEKTRQLMPALLKEIVQTLEILANRVLGEAPPKLRKLYEQLITELVYQRDVTRNMIKECICSEMDFYWLYRMRFYWNRSEKDVLKKLEIRISRAKFYYGFEYFGAKERLVQTPLTDKAYLTMCEALHAKMGANPFGPAGTGKTESVKSLGAQLGRFVLVFCCDETFDYNAMSRIFIGLCQCGAWGCFDEFNRLEEQMLSAVSQQILAIQEGLRLNNKSIMLNTTRGAEKVMLDGGMGIFVTMNPGYAGRSELPDNLKQLFRGLAMMAPNRVLIGQVMLFSQGFGSAEALSGKIVLLFELCKDQLSKQSHYDFGLRALKSVLRSAGNLKRSEQAILVKETPDEKVPDDGIVRMDPKLEETILIRSLMSTVVPKLVRNDKFLFDSLLDSAFPGADIQGFKEAELKAKIEEVAAERNFKVEPDWLVKLMQLHTIQNITHGVMLVGPSGSGKTGARSVLLEAMSRLDGIKSEQYEIDPKAIVKDELYGVLDPTTLEWTDGVFTATLRTIIDNMRGEANRRHWIVFDGDVDPEWAENLNSVLDDNKMLTLPNGERLVLTPNIRIMFETPTLYYATPATVSRCGMVWFSNDCVTLPMLIHNQLEVLRTTPTHTSDVSDRRRIYAEWENVHNCVCDHLYPILTDEGGILISALDWVKKKPHVMTFTDTRAIWSLFSLLKGALFDILEHNENNDGMTLSDDQMQAYAGKYLLYAIMWSFGGPMKLDIRAEFGGALCEMASLAGIEPPDVDGDTTLIDFEVVLESQDWQEWKERVMNEELTPQGIKDPTVVINTIDTIRHARVIGTWLQEQKPIILCGPPGSGKSMTLAAVLRAAPQCEMITLNFSSTAGTDLVFKAFEQHCKIQRTSQGYTLKPVLQGKILVIFCDECNLPSADLYGTQTIVTFIRQLIDKGGYWHPVDKNWITLTDIQFVGACNPPTDAGRVVLNPRFLNLCPLVLVDFPGKESLLEIYGTFVRALLKLTPSIKGLGDALTAAMVEVYQRSQRHFSPDMQAHYVYSPRELSRWIRAMYSALAELDDVGGTTPEEIVRLWAHEALRLFSDRLVHLEERQWTVALIKDVSQSYFNGVNLEEALAEPILFSDYLSPQKNYVSVGKEEMREYILERIKVFNDEELDVQLVVYNELLDHILRIDRVLRQPLGHLLMVGASGAGKTVFSRFVSWMNGMSTFQLKVHKDYSAEDFDIDLRAVLIRSGVKGEKITFIFDESNILDTAFLERMNALLASGEVPGLFEDAEYQQLIRDCREQARADGLILDTEEELYRMFTKNIQNNLHIVFTMNPAGGDFSDRAATSPALFNRCVINWWGTWPREALLQVAREFTHRFDLGVGVPAEMRDQKEADDEGNEISLVHKSVAESIVEMHGLVEKVMEYLAKNMYNSTFVTPRHYLDLIRHFVKLFEEKREELEEQQKHLSVGLKALQETEEEVSKRQVELNEKEKTLTEQQAIADAKLNEMMESEKVATKSRKQAIEVEEVVSKEMVKITARSEKVEAELAEAKPALEAAQKSVSNIQKKQLDEIRALRNPPAKVKMTLEAVCIVLNKVKIKKIKDWGLIKKALADAKFIPALLKFNTDDITNSARKVLHKEYLANPDFNFEAVNKSSRACGPMVAWVISQVKFAHLLQSVDPMRKEISSLKAALASKQQQAIELRDTVNKLEAQITEYKAEYARMVQRITELKNEMEIVQKSMTRAKKLLLDLSEEKVRWGDATANFQKQLSTLVADCLISAGFLTYIGYYNITYRQILVSKWKAILEKNGLPFNDGMELASYLSAPAERIAWAAAKLPDDTLCVENAIILKRFNRYPLVVDPSGQACAYLLAFHKAKKIVRTSFLDSAFLKNLESGLRFGNALLIEDVENMDPILNPVLNREVQTIGGRTIIKLANKDIDFSPTFTMFLVTRDPASAFTPDLCSRVTFVNFSVTPSSLQSQCLGKILKSEAPEIDEQRTDQLRLQGEFKFQLRELEDQLLDALNSITGNILDDPKIMTVLEDLKLKAKVIQEKTEQSQRVLEEIDDASRFYTPFAKGCTKLYFSWEALASVYFLYQFDLKSFLDIVTEVLTDKKLPEILAMADSKDREARMLPLLKAMHRLVYIRTKRSLLVKDHIMFGMRVAQVYIDCHPDDEKFVIKDEYMQFILKGIGYKEGKELDSRLATKLELSSIGALLVGNMCELNGFDRLKDDIDMNVDDWKAYRTGGASIGIPNEFNTGSAESAHAKALEKMVIQKGFRPDQIIRTAREFVEAVFDWNLYEFDNNADSLMTIVLNQCDQDTPVLMASRPGNDPSSKIDQLAVECFEAQSKRKYEAFAMGSPDDYAKADNAVTQATKRGTWVLLKNVHLAPQWLQGLEKRLHRMKKHQDFRLFLTMEMVDKVAVTLLRKSLIMINEPPLGVKASLQRTFNNVTAQRVDRAPEERSRLYVLLGWLHAVVLERLRFEPLGWSKAFEFSETDRYCAMDAMDEWIDRLANNRSNVDPNEIPWDAMHKMLVQYVYGGRIDNNFDTSRLTSFVQNLFTAEAYNPSFALASRCVSTDESEVKVGRLGYVRPVINGEKTEKEILARVVQVTDQFKIVYMTKYIVSSSIRVNLNGHDNWIAPGDFRAQGFRMEPAITLPQKCKFADIKQWVLDVDDKVASNPAMIGLPPRAELLILAKRAEDLTSNLQKLQDVETGNAMEELTAILDSTEEDDKAGAVPGWLKTLRVNAEKWVENLPEGMPTLPETADSIKNPLFRFMKREFQIGTRVLNAMRTGLNDLIGFVEGEIKATNELRQLIAALSRDQIPRRWSLYTVGKLGVFHFIVDFVKRLAQLQVIMDVDFVNSPYDTCLWLGGVFSPAGFVAATRQYVANKNRWPLESLVLTLEVGVSEKADNCFLFEALTLFGAGWEESTGCLILTEKTQTPLPKSRFRWVNGDDEKDPRDYASQAPDKLTVGVPVYLNQSFKDLLFSVRLPVYSSLPDEIWVQLAVSISVWTT